ncbi:MAG: histidine kinase [Ruminococcus sp.]|nr:histidine kinase [Ruminococcus sp.]
MTNKIMKSIMLVSGVAVLITIILVTMLMNSYSREKTAEGLKQDAVMIASAVEMNGGRYLNETEFGDITRVTWISQSGKVIFDSLEDPESLDDHSDRKEVRDAVENGEGISSRYSDTILHTTINYALRLSDGSIIRVSGIHRSILAQMMNMIGTIIIILAAAALISAASAVIISRNIVRPINDIDLESPNTAACYRELEPLLNKLRVQNARVGRQMDELRTNQDQFELIMGSMSEGIIIADQKLNVVAQNAASAGLLGSSLFSTGHSIYALNNSEGFRRCLLDALGGRRSECIIHTGNGDREVIASPAKSMEMVCGVAVFIMDITEKQKLETMRREFTANVSHELKTPLTTIYGISDMLAGGIVKAEDVAGFGANIRSEAERLISLVTDTIALSKLDEGNIIGEKETVDLIPFVNEILSRLKLAAAEKGVSTSVSGDNVSIKCERQLLSETLYNICDNGIKYNKQGGSLEVSVSEKKKHVLITVKDTGIGIPPEQQDRIFERFYRGDKSRSGKIKGTGLGLSIVKHSVMRMGGNIRVESTPDHGTAFTIELPVQ